MPEVDDEPLKVCVVIDNEASARSAVRKIQRVSKSTKFRLTLLNLERFSPASNGGILAHPPLDSDLFVVAMNHGGALPNSAKALIERWAYSREQDKNCALVALVTKAGSQLDSRTQMVEYLRGIAAACGMAFFYGIPQEAISIDSPQPHVHAAYLHQSVPSYDHLQERWGINE